MDLAIALEGFFFEKVNRSTGQRLTFTLTILYMIDDARLTPPRCKKHTAYDDTRLTPHHCKNYTPSFAHSTGKFPSDLLNFIVIFSSADPKVSSAELMVLLICPSSVVVVRRPSSVVRRRRPSVNFCFKSLLLLEFLFDHSEFFTGETRHIVPPCNKAGISNFCLEFQKLQKFQIS